MSGLFDAVDALVASRSPLPPPAERRRLRQAHALTLDEVASALGVRRATVGGWESGKAEPRPPEREAYARLLKQLAALYPAPENPGTPQEDSGTAAPQTSTTAAPAAQAGLTGGAAKAAATAQTEQPPAAPPAPVRHAAATQRPAPRAERAPQSTQRPVARKAAPANTPAPGGVYAHGPLLVLDADTEQQVTGYGVGGLILDVPAKSLPALVEWTLSEAQLGAERLHGSGKDADALLVLTEAVWNGTGCPPRCRSLYGSPGGWRRGTRSSSSFSALTGSSPSGGWGRGRGSTAPPRGPPKVRAAVHPLLARPGRPCVGACRAA